MDQLQLHFTLGRHGVRDSALEDAVRRAAHHFEGTEPTPDELERWCATLREQASHLFQPLSPTDPPAAGPTPVVPDWLSPQEKLTRHRQSQPAPPPKAKPGPWMATGAQLRALEGKTLHEKLTAAHARAVETPDHEPGS